MAYYVYVSAKVQKKLTITKGMRVFFLMLSAIMSDLSKLLSFCPNRFHFVR